MKKLILMGAAILGGMLLSAPAAHATTPEPTFESCKNLAGWYPNEDEQDRRPTATVNGLKFEGDDLIHHEVTGLTVTDLEPGTYALATGSDAPDQPSFFSVEVRKADGTGYATLRWNPTASKWEMTTGGQFYTDADPAVLVTMPPTAKGDKVFSFGVGYTKNPPGTKTAIVKSVTFNGSSPYSLTCPPKVVVTPTPTKTSASPTRTPRPSASSSAPVGSGGGSDSGNTAGGLPVTGDSTAYVFGGAIALLALGSAAVLFARRRKTSFTA